MLATSLTSRLRRRAKWAKIWVYAAAHAVTYCDFLIVFAKVAEREGFEPPVELPPRRISSAVHSTTLPPLREIVRPAMQRPVDKAGLMT